MSDRRPPLLDRPMMREQFRKELRFRLMSEAVVVLAPRPSRLSFPMVLRPALAVAVILVLAVAGATSAAASSLPGDALYAVKLANEDVRLALTFDGTARLHLLSELADRRLQELTEVAQQRPSAAPAATQQYADAVDKVARALEDRQGSSNNQSGDDIQEAQAQRLRTLDSIKETIPNNARAGVERLLQREKDRQTKTPAAPPTTAAPTTEAQDGDQPNGDAGNAKKATPHPATPQPQRATPRPDSTGDANDQRHD